ncbi:UspA domain-containing protein [Caldithrix abyssi DSM 13497]|uniref:Nucleotide-binding universal stress protein, UspA family n=1 Tax=Caldithrix abyssi DSM 13497 TaxID=880073 RepID=H1XXL4_CALAY|nr:universal stress protein [Caldithrix abyssi]APF19227.1 Nucleotide-binding universal stress protein, UspA family [Caldithrix abyssi DSM 13497]EHO43138.1 UspA domain-containing protein [Caldithrix abyssi DSM 13497]
MDIKRILVPTDFSETARAALDQALFLAARYDAELTVLHARLLFEDDPAELEHKLKDLKAEEKEVEHALLDKLRKKTADHSHLNIKHEIIRGYSAPSAILGYINNKEFDLVVIGTHGRSGLEHFLIGSVAEKVVRYARCPVLTVRSAEYIKEKFEKILVPLDFSEPAMHALKTAANWVEEEGGELHLLYAVEQEVHPALYAWGMKSVFDMIPDIKEKVEKRMEEAIAQIPKLKKVAVKKVIREGKPHKVIAKYVEEEKPHLIVIGTHGMVGLDRFLLGSTTERVIRAVKIPVLTVKNKNVI